MTEIGGTAIGMSGFYQPNLIPGLEEALRIVRSMNEQGCTSLDIEVDLANELERRRRYWVEARRHGDLTDAITGRCLDITGEITLDRDGVTVGTFLSDNDRAFAVQAWNAARDALAQSAASGKTLTKGGAA